MNWAAFFCGLVRGIISPARIYGRTEYPDLPKVEQVKVPGADKSIAEVLASDWKRVEADIGKVLEREKLK